MARQKANSVTEDLSQIEMAVELIKHQPRLQMLTELTSLSRERLLNLYKEINQSSPTKGQLPFSTDYFLVWNGNVHASLFYNRYLWFKKHSNLPMGAMLAKAYTYYQTELKAMQIPVELSITRAWMLVKYFDAGMLTLTACVQCGGHFVTNPYDLQTGYCCGFCKKPPRAGSCLVKDKQTSKSTCESLMA